MDLKNAIKVVLDNQITVDDGSYVLYKADGEFVTEDDPLVYVVMNSVNIEDLYIEYSTFDEAYEEYIKLIRG